jgi:gamma-glutamyl phosphate reductase
MLAAAVIRTPSYTNTSSSFGVVTNQIEQINQVCSALSGQSAQVPTPSTASLGALLRESINRLDGADEYKQQCVQHIVPVMVSSKQLAQDMMAYRYAILLCRNLIGRSNCEALAMYEGFIPFIQKAMTNTHKSISGAACDAMMKLIAHSPEPRCVLCNAELSSIVVLRAALDNLSPTVDSNKCLDAIRVLTLMNQNSLLSPDGQLCNSLVSTFYENTTPFVSKQTAGLILVLIEDDADFKQAVCRRLTEQAQPNKPIGAAKCWKEVNDVMSLVCL